MPRCLEDLCNEILMIILEYVASPVAIYHSFRRLNYRFDLLLHSVGLNLDIFTEDKQTLAITRYFAAHCNRLRLDTICPLIALENFPRLRSLTIIEPTDVQIHSIQSKIFPMLEYLASPASRVSNQILIINISIVLYS